MVQVLAQVPVQHQVEPPVLAPVVGQDQPLAQVQVQVRERAQEPVPVQVQALIRPVAVAAPVIKSGAVSVSGNAMNVFEGYGRICNLP
jgi:hypothetical protein